MKNVIELVSIRSIKDRLRPRWLKAGRKWVSSRLRLASIARRYGLPPPTTNPWSGLRRNDTLFVLGSGASINDYGKREWSAIAAADSVGFNNWMLHPFLPTFFVTEPGKDLTQLAAEYRNIERRGYGAAGVPILIKDGERYRYGEMCQVLEAMPATLLPRLALSWDWEMQESDPTRFRGNLRWLHRLGMIAGTGSPVLRKRASVVFITLLALRAGYRRVVLCGIDLNGTSYFFANHRKELVAEGYWVPAPPLNATHKTNDTAFGAITVAKALEILREEILEPSGLDLFVAQRTSALYPMLPAYFEP